MEGTDGVMVNGEGAAVGGTQEGATLGKRKRVSTAAALRSAGFVTT
jgi:hypothetical protein